MVYIILFSLIALIIAIVKGNSATSAEEERKKRNQMILHESRYRPELQEQATSIFTGPSTKKDVADDGIDYTLYQNNFLITDPGKNDDKWLDKIDGMTAEETEKWFDSKKTNGVFLSSDIMNAVWDKLAEYHEPKLLIMLSKITPGKVDGWVRARKRDGYFFTADVYSKALEIRKLKK